MISRYQDDRDAVTGAPDSFLNFETTKDGHAQVQHNAIWSTVGQSPQKYRTRDVLLHGVACRTQNSGDCMAHMRVIVNEGDQGDPTR